MGVWLAVLLTGCSGSGPRGLEKLPTSVRERRGRALDLGDLEPATRQEVGGRLAHDAVVAALKRYEVRGFDVC